MKSYIVFATTVFLVSVTISSGLVGSMFILTNNPLHPWVEYIVEKWGVWDEVQLMRAFRTWYESKSFSDQFAVVCFLAVDRVLMALGAFLALRLFVPQLEFILRKKK